MTRKSDQTRMANERRAEQLQIRAALARTPESKPRAWKCSITPADVHTGREYERAAIAAAEREANAVWPNCADGRVTGYSRGNFWSSRQSEKTRGA